MVSQSTIVVVDVVCQALCFVRVFLLRFDSYVRHACNPWDSRFDSIRFDTDSIRKKLWPIIFTTAHLFPIETVLVVSPVPPPPPPPSTTRRLQH